MRNEQLSYSAIISAKLREALEAKGMKQADLVKLIGLGKSAISQYLSGKVTPKQDKIELLAKALNVDASWLIGVDEKDLQEKQDSPIASKFRMLQRAFEKRPVQEQDKTMKILDAMFDECQKEFEKLDSKKKGSN